mmetsp:Transcript_5957/g.15121  ORF Transcript_5957/g.15121 Transcript_5957/m.15121 type:complete len:435 (-) Transcript_5957:147-1451(-)|eukprot:CAMPEP_0174237078 /NCGR_PEP_ID=MMETSP0417-20130205/6812_1 /TAXON_ID=242541 /ORGANISM="Mayorella sp, Strain BSH-02190019" /LENGTH=434 /DNA_ID=CAMNT_0015315799 /DNA_START=72 /DNA_END=1376 /DNA_ORIENTATION=+
MSDENVIKVSHRGEVRRVRTDHRLNYEELESLTCKLFPYLSGQTIRLTYRDEDNDHVTFTNDEELAEAYQLNPRLYVRVRTLSSPKTTMRRFVKVTSKPNPNLTAVAAEEQEQEKKNEEEESAALVPMPQKFRDSFLALYREGYAPAENTYEALLMAGGCVSTARTALRQALGVDVVAEPRDADAMPDAPLVMSADFTASALKLVAMYGVDRQADVVDALIRYGGNEPNACLSLMNESVCNPASMRDEILRALQESAALAKSSRAAEEAAVLKERELAVQAALRAETEAAAEAKRRQEEAAAAARRREEARRLREEKARHQEELERRAAAEAQAKREAALAEQKRIQAETQRQLEEARAARKHLEEQVREQKSKQLLLSIMASCRFANETAAADYQSKLVLLRDMGFHDLNRSHSALQRHNGDLEKTVEFLTNA